MLAKFKALDFEHWIVQHECDWEGKEDFVGKFCPKKYRVALYWKSRQ